MKKGYLTFIFAVSFLPTMGQLTPLNSIKVGTSPLQNPELAKNGEAQLSWLYRNSKYYEKTYLRYPIGRLTSAVKLEFK